MMTLELDIQHATRYVYSAAVVSAQHLAHLEPLHDEHQALLAHELSIEPVPDERQRALDAGGNAGCWFSLRHAHRELDVQARSRVRVAPRFDGLRAHASPPWEQVAASLRYRARASFDPAVEYAQPSAHVPRLAALRDYAASSLTPGRPLAAAAIELMRRVHADFRYASGSTQVDTPLERVLEQRQGVCQDFAHLMAGALRMHGVPVRYVSGYLLTRAPGDTAAMLGADATHAWVQVWVPGTPGVPAEGWLDLDPTNNLVPAAGHVRLAVGRDYGDVTPLRGVIRGGGQHRLSVAVHVGVVEPSPEPALDGATRT